MTKTDLRLEYGKETGHQLETINTVADHNDPETKEYLDWLESIALCYFLAGKVHKKFTKALDDADIEIK
jgi:hypothetical protein